ncbi:hypothetical protein KQI63_04610 [bacterium]|nr:hypothetical protein [bacterium]
MSNRPAPKNYFHSEPSDDAPVFKIMSCVTEIELPASINDHAIIIEKYHLKKIIDGPNVWKIAFEERYNPFEDEIYFTSSSEKKWDGKAELDSDDNESSHSKYFSESNSRIRYKITFPESLLEDNNLYFDVKYHRILDFKKMDSNNYFIKRYHVYHYISHENKCDILRVKFIFDNHGYNIEYSSPKYKKLTDKPGIYFEGKNVPENMFFTVVFYYTHGLSTKWLGKIASSVIDGVIVTSLVSFLVYLFRLLF